MKMANCVLSHNVMYNMHKQLRTIATLGQVINLAMYLEN